MRQASRTPRALLRAVALLAAFAGGAGVAAGGAGPAGRIVASGGTCRFLLAAGEEMALALPEGAEIAAVAAVEDGWIAAGTRAVAGRSELFLLRGDQAAATPLPAPAGAGRMRSDPVPLVSGGALTALAWLEGAEERSLAVRFARWEEDGWGPARTVAAPGPGTQIALAAEALADGSWLLAWSRYDGTDDEVVWSRSRGPDGEAWTPPRRLASDNAVPDITPALLATPGGALAAWSRYDGEHYRVVTAAFDGRAWSEPRVAGPAGSLYPTWEAAAGATPAVLARTAVPRGWVLLELDAAGRPRRAAAVAASGTERPAVEAGGDEVTFRWLGSGEKTEDQVGKKQVTVPWAKLP